jgi:uncharacterized membrane protein YgdD (TMEM256/DUF423 family)
LTASLAQAYVRFMDQTFFTTGAVFALLAVAAGAFGAHALGPRMTPQHLATYETAARYQMYHALALIAVSFAMSQWPSAALLTWSGRLFIAGIIIFCATLYVIALGGPRWLGAITPIGGLCFMAGWATAAYAVWRS